MRDWKKMMVLGMTCASVLGGTITVSAADVQEGQTTSASTEISLTKENPAPVFSVGIPASVTVVSDEPSQLSFTMSEEHLNQIPEGKKVSVSIADAGYGDTSGVFALGTEDGKTAPYTIFSSKYSTRPTDTNYNRIGALLVSFYGNEKVTDGTASIGRVIKMDNYEELEAGSYAGYLTFQIDVRDQ